MNSQNLLMAINDIDGKFILSAQKKLGIGPAGRLPRRTLPRAAAIAAVILLLVSAGFITALAASSEFRELIFPFLSSGEPEHVPEVPDGEAGSMEVLDPKITVGGIIEGTYIHFPELSAARNGVFTVCIDTVQMNSGSHYDGYCEENGRFLRLEKHDFCRTYEILGNQVPVEFQWVAYQDSVTIIYQPHDPPFYKPACSGGVDSTLMLLRIDPPGALEYTLYPVLIDVQTGALTDICAGLGIEKLPEILNAAISKDLRRMLLVDWDGTLYYADLAGKTLHVMDDLLGTRCRAAALTEDTLICWTEADGVCDVYALDPDTLEGTQVYAGTPAFLRGFDNSFLYSSMYPGTRFAVEVANDRHVTVIDLENGDRYTVEGFSWPEGDVSCVPSTDGNKLLIYTRNAATYFDSVGVLDFSRRCYTAFSRENLNEVNERAIYWFDDQSIMVETAGRDGSKAYYLYKLLTQ